ncbi:hypothetical protein QM012_007645 [Aureobasidium pullulans]|uniref:SRP9 domain-containing protein n=1 Tax=Aureobasidium pullulans TaxID=5580 RepID=A0ABR0TLU7_AURPU
MPYFTSSEEWQRQSALLLQARPTTTRITTKYSIPSASSLSSKPTTTDSSSTDQQKQPIVAVLELKTYDPVSGTTLKYKTDKAAEVGRLIAAMGTLGREMAALPEVKGGDVAMIDAPVEGTETPVEATVPATQQSTAGKKKKKGKK